MKDTYFCGETGCGVCTGGGGGDEVGGAGTPFETLLLIIGVSLDGVTVAGVGCDWVTAVGLISRT